MTDDIVTRLRGGDEKLPPATCWHCDEWGCENKHGEPVPCDCYDSCDCDNNCDCDCHSWRDIVARAADEIERLRGQIKAFVHEWELSERGVHNGAEYFAAVHKMRKEVRGD